MKIRTRFAIAGTICTSVIAVGVGGLLFRQTTADLRSSFDRQLAARVQAVGPVVATAPDADRLVDVLSANAQGVGIRVLRPGQPEVRVGDVPVYPPGLNPQGLVTVRQGDASWRAVQQTVAPSAGSDDAGSITVQVFGPLGDLNHRIDVLRRRVILVSLASITLAAFSSWIVGGFAALPMRRLTAATEGLGDVPAPERRVAEDQGVDEVDELSHTINRLLERVQDEHAQTTAALEAARAFSWNAVHELRSPLMSMRTDLDVLADSPGLDEDKQMILRGMILQHERTTKLLTALHDLARTELQNESLFSRVDLAEIADAVCDAVRARHPGINIEFASPDHVWLHGWGEGLSLLADNIIENAAKHGAQTSERQLMVVRVENDPMISFTVDDSGPGIAPDDRDRIFDRFIRGASGQPGLGIGLALVRQQLKLHRAEITVGESPLGGARFVVRWPDDLASQA